MFHKRYLLWKTATQCSIFCKKKLCDTTFIYTFVNKILTCIHWSWKYPNSNGFPLISDYLSFRLKKSVCVFPPIISDGNDEVQLQKVSPSTGRLFCLDIDGSAGGRDAERRNLPPRPSDIHEAPEWAPTMYRDGP